MFILWNKSFSNVIDFVNIVTTGNATDFGDAIPASKRSGTGGIGASATRGVFTGGVSTGGSELTTN